MSSLGTKGKGTREGGCGGKSLWSPLRIRTSACRAGNGEKPERLPGLYTGTAAQTQMERMCWRVMGPVRGLGVQV